MSVSAEGSGDVCKPHGEWGRRGELHARKWGVTPLWIPTSPVCNMHARHFLAPSNCNHLCCVERPPNRHLAIRHLAHGVDRDRPKKVLFRHILTAFGAQHPRLTPLKFVMLVLG